MTTQVPVPVQAPPQPSNDDPAAGVAESVTVDPVGKVPWQDGPQAMPAGALPTEPLPVPVFATTKGWPDFAK